MIPHEVVSHMVDGATPIRDWREHLNLTQEEVAKRMGISQPAFAQQETVAKPRKAPARKLRRLLESLQSSLSSSRLRRDCLL